MITIVRIHGEGEGYDPVLTYDAESEQLWGNPQMWDSHVNKVGLSEEEFASFFDGPYKFPVDLDGDPFEDIPNAEDLFKNYPPGSEEIPDLPNPPLPGEYRDEGGEDEDPAEKAADAIAEAALDAVPGDESGNLKTAESASSGLSKDQYEKADDFMLDMTKNLCWWEGDDLSKAPMAWPSDDSIPEFVKEVIKAVINGDVVWDKFSGYSRQAAEAIQNSFEENLTQPQGWSIKSLVEDLQDLYPGMEQKQAFNIARTETSAILNSAREEAYERRDDSDDYVYYWSGPSDHRRTEVCKEIVEEVEARGGNVRMETLREILREKARKYHNTEEGGTPERVDEWTPHYQCRHTFVRDVKATL